MRQRTSADVTSSVSSANVASLLAGGQVMDVVLDPDEAAQVRPGDRVTLAAQGFSPLVMRQPDTGTY